MKYEIIFCGESSSSVKPGQNLEGELRIRNESYKVQQMKGLRMKLRGMEKRTFRKRSTTRTCWKKECDVLRDGNVIASEGTVYLQSGENIFTFTCHLPEILSPSGQGSHWTINYDVRLVTKWTIFGIQIFGKKNTVQTKPVIIEPYLDLDRRPFDEVSKMKIWQSYCVHWGEDVVSATLHLKRSGWTRGETISARTLVVNRSQLTQKVSCSLLQIEKIKYGSDIKMQEKNITTTRTFLIQPDKDQRQSTWEDILLDGMPNDLMPSGHLGSDKIQISYLLRLTIEQDTIVVNHPLVIEAPIFIGTAFTSTGIHSVPINEGQRPNKEPSSGIERFESSSEVGRMEVQNPSFPSSSSQPAPVTMDCVSVSSYHSAGHQTKRKEYVSRACRSTGNLPSSTSRFALSVFPRNPEIERMPLLGRQNSDSYRVCRGSSAKGSTEKKAWPPFWNTSAL